MSQIELENPFHAGELDAQMRAGVGDVASWAAGFIRDQMPLQHSEFFASLPFVVLSAADEIGRPWVTILDGEDGFIRAPNAEKLTFKTDLDPQDPLYSALSGGTDVGFLGIELATRRRNRMSGRFRPDAAGFAIDVRQSFGNCPQYITERDWTRTVPGAPRLATQTSNLSDAQQTLIHAADTMFIGTGHSEGPNLPARGYDASHRGGAPGFVEVVDRTHLRIPDYAGNNFFNTIGNLLCDPRVGLLFVDFETGGLLQITGTARIDWAPENPKDPGARRVIDIAIDAVIERPGAIRLRWQKDTAGAFRMQVAKKVRESSDVTSFYLKPVDGQPVEPFIAGQHLPIELQIPGQFGAVKRSYSLSGAPDDTNLYRISIKREGKGLVSQFFHDKLEQGDVVDVRAPSGDFVIADDHFPLVLVSAGVGITPMLSMLYFMRKYQAERPVWFVHGTRNGASHALRDELNTLIDDLPNARRRVYYSRPDPGDTHGRDYDSHGRIMAADLLALGAGFDAHYMLCGPAAFLSEIRQELEAADVPANQIHFEIFGPTG